MGGVSEGVIRAGLRSLGLLPTGKKAKAKGQGGAKGRKVQLDVEQLKALYEEHHGKVGGNGGRKGLRRGQVGGMCEVDDIS